MFSIDEESRKYFESKLGETQALRVFFGGHG
jgi:hypothetical protein